MRSICIVLILSATSAWAQSKSSLTFIAWDDWPVWQKTTQYANKAFQKRGYTAFQYSFLETEETRNANGNLEFMMDENKNGKMKGQAKDVLTKWLSGPGDSKLLYLIDHGTDSGLSAPDGLKPSEVQYGLKFPDMSKMTFADLNKLVQQSKKPRQKIKIIASQCFSGGVHDIAVDNANVCALSATSKDNLYRLNKEVINPFDQAVLDQVQNKGSLFSAYASGLARDTANQGGAELSSIYYARKVLNTKSKDRDQNMNTNLDFYFAQLSKSLQNCQEEEFRQRGMGLGKSISGAFPLGQQTGCQASNKGMDSSLHDINNALGKLVDANEIHFEIPPEDYKSLPPGHQKLYDTVAKINRPHFEKFQKTLKEKIETMAELRQVWDSKQKAYKQCMDKRGAKTCDDLFKHELRSTNATIRQQLAAIKESIPEIIKFSKMVGGLKDLGQALRKGSPQQVTKLKSLMACEDEPL